MIYNKAIMTLRERVKQFFGIPVSNGVKSTPFIDHLGSPDSRATVLYDKYEGIVYSAVNVKAETIASADFELYKKNGQGEWQHVSDHPFMQVLNNPHKGFSKYELMLGTASFYEIAGEAFWYFALGEQSGKPKEIYILHPQKTKIVVDTVTGEVVGYEYMKSSSDKIFLDANEVLHFKKFNPDNPYRGYGTIQAGLTYIDTEQYSSRFTKNFFKNNATPAGIVTVNTADKAEFESFKRRWKERYGGSDNAGKVAFIRGQEVNFQKLSLGLNEIDMQALKNLSEDSILKMFRVPKALLGFADTVGLGRANVESLEYIFAKYVIEPMLKQFDDMLQIAINTYYPTENLLIEHDDMIPADRESRIKEYQAGVDVWLSRNEIREQMGLAPYDNGNSLYVDINKLPVDGMSAPVEQKQLSAPTVIKLAVKKKDQKQADDNTPDLEKNEAYRQQLMRLQAVGEREAYTAIRRYLMGQKRRVTDELSATKGIVSKAYLVISEENAKLIAAVYPVAEKLAGDTGKLSFAFIGEPIDDFVLSDTIKAETMRRVQLMAGNYNQETLAAIEASLNEGYQQGESLAGLKRRINEIYNDASGYRAERVARTETLKAGQIGTESAYKQVPYVTKKVWFTNPGACEFCSELGGKTVGISESYKEIGDSVTTEDGATMAIDYDTIDTPPLHPNCRCIILPSS